MILSRGNILLVDDEPLVLEMFEKVLSEEGYDVTVAGSSKEAIDIIEKKNFDVLITDVLLDDNDGFEIQNIAKKYNPGISVILITGAPNPVDAQRAFIYGIRYLSKPTGFETLLKAVSEALEKSKQFTNDKVRATG